jgi:hypothetical protein
MRGVKEQGCGRSLNCCLAARQFWPRVGMRNNNIMINISTHLRGVRLRNRYASLRDVHIYVWWCLWVICWCVEVVSRRVVDEPRNFTNCAASDGSNIDSVSWFCARWRLAIIYSSLATFVFVYGAESKYTDPMILITSDSTWKRFPLLEDIINFTGSG